MKCKKKKHTKFALILCKRHWDMAFAISCKIISIHVSLFLTLSLCTCIKDLLLNVYCSCVFFIYFFVAFHYIVLVLLFVVYKFSSNKNKLFCISFTLKQYQHSMTYWQNLINNNFNSYEMKKKDLFTLLINLWQWN